MVQESPTLIARYREARRDERLAVLEGFHALKHAVRFGAVILDARASDPDAVFRLAADLAPDIADRIRAMVEPVDGRTYAELSPAPHPTGTIALARRPAVDPAAVLAEPGPAPVVLLDRPAHHGNIGAVVRVAAAAGAAGVLVTGNHDPWHASSLRGGAGLQFALPVARIAELPATGRPVVALDPGGQPLGGRASEAGPAVPRRAVLVFGSERAGVGAALLDRADARVAIPMKPGVSSLNLATAVAVALYCAGA
jgi:RNA methyltransferase, TrmH family